MRNEHVKKGVGFQLEQDPSIRKHVRLEPWRSALAFSFGNVEVQKSRHSSRLVSSLRKSFCSLHTSSPNNFAISFLSAKGTSILLNFKDFQQHFNVILTLNYDLIVYSRTKSEKETMTLDLCFSVLRDNFIGKCLHVT